MVVVGDVKVPAIQSQVATAFSGWKGGHALPALPPLKDPKHASELTIPVPGKESVSVLMGAPSGLHYTDADYLPLAVGTNVLGHGFTSRLTSTVRDTEGLTYGIGAGLSGTGKFEQLWLMPATFAPSLLKQGLQSTHRELEKWYHEGISEAELDYRKSAMGGAHRVNLTTSAGVAQTILSTVLHGMDLSWIDDYPKKLAALSVDQVNAAINQHADPAKLVTVRAGSISK